MLIKLPSKIDSSPVMQENWLVGENWREKARVFCL